MQCLVVGAKFIEFLLMDVLITFVLFGLQVNAGANPLSFQEGID